MIVGLDSPSDWLPMGFRFRESFRILPGVRMNLSRSGRSWSFGGRGATMNVSNRGVRKAYKGRKTVRVPILPQAKTALEAFDQAKAYGEFWTSYVRSSLRCSARARRSRRPRPNSRQPRSIRRCGA